MTKVLVTGFGPFSGFNTNPSEVLTRHLELDGVVLRKEIFQVNQEDIINRYPSILADFQPDIILNLGLSSSTGGFRLESFAVNILRDQTTFQSIGNIAGHATTIDTNDLADFLNRKGFPSLRSDHAGNYYCNFIYYLSLDWCQQHAGKALFIHIPFTSELASTISIEKKALYSSLPQNMMLKGIQHIVEYLDDGPLI